VRAENFSIQILPLLQQEIYFQKQACEKRKEKKERKKVQ
jgi:hypothetical protein